MFKNYLYHILGSKKIAMLCAFIIFLLLVISTEFDSIFNDNCRSAQDFKEEKYDHVIINKYINTENHSVPVLLLEDNKTGYNVRDEGLSLEVSYLYNYLSIGDTIKKQTGTNTIRLINPKIDTTYIIDFDCNRH